MSIPGQCPGCSRKFNAPDQYAGKSVKCPQCGSAMVIGSASPIAAGSPPSRGSAAAASVQPQPGNDFSFNQTAPTPRASRSSGNGLLIVGGILAAGFVLLCMGVGTIGAWWYYTGSSGGQWKEYAPGGGGFSVLMPGAPDQKDRTDSKIAAATPIHEAVAENAGSKIRYSVEYYDLAGRPINDYLYQSFLKHRLLSEGGKLAREQDVSASPYTGKEFVVNLPDNQVVVRRVYLAEARVFVVTAKYPDAPAKPREIEKFLDSFKITSVAKAPAEPVLVAEAPKPTKKETTKPTPTRPTPTKPEPRVTKKEEPKPVEPPPAPAPGPFPVSEDEDAVLKHINQLRGEAKVQLVTEDKKLFEIARDAARAKAEGKVGLLPNDVGYERTFLQPIAGMGLTAPKLMELLLKQQQAFKQRMSDPAYQGIGIGIATAKDGTTHCILLFGINRK